jgi:membrane protein implicated in regulation of membrane protease activity
VRPPDGDPSGLAWLIGLLGLMLPWVAVPIGIGGVWMALGGNTTGWWLMGASVAMLVLDLVIDIVWMRRTGEHSDQPMLNQRGAQHIGRQVRVIEDLVGGEGKVRVADTVWRARGPNCVAGAWVRVVSVEGPYLVVAPSESSPEDDRGKGLPH